jgi:putative FmdB family regulatory protein
MPTYTYRCKSCGHELEEFQRISDPPVVTCPSCGKDTLARLIGGGAGLVFKGSGFYLTDYKSKSTPSGGNSGHDEPKPSKSGTASKSDSSSSTPSSSSNEAGSSG